MNDISPNFKGPNPTDSAVITHILKYQETPFAIQEFSRLCKQLSHDSYWIVLSTLWVSYSGHSDLNLWRKLFRSGRKKRSSSIMKPSEFEAFKKLTDTIIAFRAHRPGEEDWISYTLDIETARRFARERGSVVTVYKLSKKDCLALFLRRGEFELIMLDPKKARFRSEVL